MVDCLCPWHNIWLFLCINPSLSVSDSLTLLPPASCVSLPVAVHQQKLSLFTSPSCLYLLTVSGNQGNWSQSLLWCQEWNTHCAYGRWDTYTLIATLLLPLLMWCQSHGFQASSSVNQNHSFIFNCFKSSNWPVWLAEWLEVPVNHLSLSVFCFTLTALKPLALSLMTTKPNLCMY